MVNNEWMWYVEHPTVDMGSMRTSLSVIRLTKDVLPTPNGGNIKVLVCVFIILVSRRTITLALSEDIAA